MDKQSIILHLDMNSYFASVEQQANPHLRGVPVGVCEHLGGIIIAPSIEAKRLGISLGTPTWEAVKICPEIKLLYTDPEKYCSVTERFMNILNDYTDEVERYSIDEAFINATKYCGSDYSQALLLALEIKQRLRVEVGEWVSASIGIGPNRVISKISADLGEGDIDRIYLVRPEEIKNLYSRLHLTDIPGIGRKIEKSLNKLGVFTLKDLADYPLENLLNQYGVTGYFLHCLGRLKDTGKPVQPEDDKAKTVGHAYTVPRVINDLSETKQLMFKLSEKVARRMRKMKASAGLVRYFHSDKQGRGFNKQKKLAEQITDGKDIYKYALSIFEQAPANSAVKIMGVSVGSLNFTQDAESLFPEQKKDERLLNTLDEINNKYGDFFLKRARIISAPNIWAKDTVGFARVRQG